MNDSTDEKESYHLKMYSRENKIDDSMHHYRLVGTYKNNDGERILCFV